MLRGAGCLGHELALATEHECPGRADRVGTRVEYRGPSGPSRRRPARRRQGQVHSAEEPVLIAGARSSRFAAFRGRETSASGMQRDHLRFDTRTWRELKPISGFEAFSLTRTAASVLKPRDPRPRSARASASSAPALLSGLSRRYPFRRENPSPISADLRPTARQLLCRRVYLPNAGGSSCHGTRPRSPIFPGWTP